VFEVMSRDVSGLQQEELDKVVNLINSRPRKILNYQTPEEVFNQIPLYENAL
jgi:IS30 family transposase